MPSNANRQANRQIDPEFIARIVRTVIARLRQPGAGQLNTHTNATAASISDKVVTVSTIEKIVGSPSQIFVVPGAVVTPAAWDAARQRGIHVHRTTPVPVAQQPKATAQQSVAITQQPRPTQSPLKNIISDHGQPERARSLEHQLAKRGITDLHGQRVLLSDTPAADLHRCIANDACRAAMVSSIADVDRFHQELRPDVWVLDMQRMNLITAVNAAAKIAQLGN